MEHYHLATPDLQQWFGYGQQDAASWDARPGGIPAWARANAQRATRGMMRGGVVTPEQPGEAYQAGFYRWMESCPVGHFDRSR